MAVAIVVQADNGQIAGANAYIAVTDFKAYHNARGNDYSAFDNPATDILAATQNFADGETLVIGGNTYTIQATLTNVQGHIHLGASLAATLTNIQNGINASGGTPGTDYAAVETADPNVTASATTTALTVTAIVFGTGGNTIGASTTAAHASWATATLAGGVGSDDKLASAIIKATDYLDSRFGFVGTKLVNNLVAATDTIAFTTVPSNNDTVVLGPKTYTFQTTLTNVDGHVAIGPDLPSTLNNLLNAINGGTSGGTPGINFAAAQTVDLNVVGSTVQATSNGQSLTVTAIVAGTPGNSIAVSTTSSVASWNTATLAGGISPQTTQWPRQSSDMTMWPWFDINFLTPIVDVTDGPQGFIALVGPDNNPVLGVPPAVKNATAEYALRALANPLYQDAPAPPGGRLIRSQTVKVDVIEQDIEYEPTQAGGFAMPAYPIADMMLARAGLINATRVVLR